MRRLFLALIALLALACGEERRGTEPPTAVIEAPHTAAPYVEVAFDGSRSSDNGLIVSYGFDFGDDSPVLISFSPTARHAYAEAGTFIVTLTVEDDLGNRGHATHELRVSEAAD